jgi:hypothetical protein
MFVCVVLPVAGSEEAVKQHPDRAVVQPHGLPLGGSRGE